jgi:hypothetical protein
MVPSAGGSVRCRARIAGVFYLITFVAGSIALASARNRSLANLVATGAYVAVTLLFYGLFRPVSRTVSLLAAIVGLLGLGMGVLNMLRLAPVAISPLVFFGVYCLLIGWLIWRSTFLPRALGALVMFGGLGWLTFAFPGLVKQLAPYNLAPGIFAEGVLTLWLLVAAVNADRWHDRARAAGMHP